MTTTKPVAAVLFVGLAVACGLARDARALSVFLSGNDLYSECSTAVRPPAPMPPKYGMCLGYVEGVMDGATVMATFLTPNGAYVADREWCEPPGIIVGQAVDVVVRYLGSHPQDRHLTAASLVARALHDAWPCKPTR
jgi:hypothetical protein